MILKMRFKFNEGLSPVEQLTQLIMNLPDIAGSWIDKLTKDKKLESQTKSIFTKANNTILYFPLITTNLVSQKQLIMVTKALERNYCTFLRLAMGLENIIDSTVKSKMEFVKKFHTNMSQDFSWDFPSQEDCKPFINPYNKKSLNDIMNETDDLNKTLNMDTKKERKEIAAAKTALAKNKSEPKEDNTMVDKNMDIVGNRGTTSKLIDNDVRTSNELIPTTFELNINVKDHNFTTILLLGVKVNAHLVDSDSIILISLNFIKSPFEASTAEKSQSLLFSIIFE